LKLEAMLNATQEGDTACRQVNVAVPDGREE
jgi:hypothetical protein